MLIDKRTASFDGRTMTADTAGDVIDMLEAGFRGTGNPVYLCAVVTDMDAASGNETYSVKWQDGTAATQAAGVTTGLADIPGTTLTFDRTQTKGEFKFVTLSGSHSCDRYIQAAFNPGGTTPSAKVTAWVQGEKPESRPFYNDAITFDARA